MSEKRTNPLRSDRGETKIGDAVVSAIAGRAVGEVDGVDPSHGGTSLPGDTSRTVGEFVGGLSGGGGARGLSVEVGEEQAAVDLTLNVVYGNPVHKVTDEVRKNVVKRVETLTGLEVTEVNVTVSDVTFPE
ncbi:MAG: Asp23/Gls24 family envelope stress response protein [Rubrobacteraceae bacterium]